MIESAATAARRPWVGQSRRRTEDPRLLRGRGRYIDDLEPLRGLVHAAILRSPYAHARIVSIDATAARQMPGGLGVLTGEDVHRLSKPFPLAVVALPRSLNAPKAGSLPGLTRLPHDL